MPGSRYEVDRVAVGVWDRDTIQVSHPEIPTGHGGA